jgi:exosome complex RNA-binding protein Csl4
LSDQPPLRRRSPTEVERSLAARLEGRRLLFEVQLTEEDLYDVKVLWHSLRRGSTWVAGEIARDYPAIHAFFMADYGVANYESNAFWSKLGVDAAGQRRIGEGFEAALSRFGLDRFPQFFQGGRALRFVSIILAHGGIPASMAERFVRQALLPALRGGTETGAELVAEWRSSPPAFFPRTVSRFLLNGGEASVDLLDRLIELAWSPRDTMPDVAARLRIPAYLAKHVIDSPAADLQRRAALPLPKVTMDPIGGVGPQVILPPVERTLAPKVVWSVRAGEGAEAQHPAFHRAQADPIPLTPFEGWWTVTPLVAGQPVRTHRFECFAENPIVCFDDGWSYIPGYAGIRLDRIWVVAAAGVTFASVEAEVHLRPLSGEREPLAGMWRGFVATHLDLAGVDALAALVDGVEKSRLAVRGSASEPTLLGTLTADVLGQQGETIYGRLPQLSLPAGHPWAVSVATPHGAAVECMFEAVNERRSIDLDQLVDERVGRYDVNVQGALGTSKRMIFGLVPGLVAHGPAAPLLPSVGDVSVRVEADPTVGLHGLRMGQPADVVVPAGEAREELWARDRGGKLGLFVSVPRLRWAMREEGANDPPTQDRIRIIPDQISASGKQVIVVSTGRPDIDVSLAVDVAGTQIQLEGPRRTGQNGVLVFPLGDLRDAFQLHAAAEVRLLVVTASQRVEIGRHQPAVAAKAARTSPGVGDQVHAVVESVSSQLVVVRGEGWSGVVFQDKLPRPIDDIVEGEEFDAVVVREDERGLKLDARHFDPSKFPTGRAVVARVIEARGNSLRVLVDGHDGVIFAETLPVDRPIDSWKAGDEIAAVVAGINRERRSIRLRVKPFDTHGLGYGTRVSAQIVDVSGDRIFVDAKGVPGAISMKDWGQRDPPRIGQSVDAWVIRINRNRGHVDLTCLPFNRLGLKAGDSVEATVLAIAGAALRVHLENEELAWIPFAELPPHLRPEELERRRARLTAVVTRVDEGKRHLVLSVMRGTDSFTFGGDAPPESPFAVLKQRPKP